MPTTSKFIWTVFVYFIALTLAACNGGNPAPGPVPETPDEPLFKTGLIKDGKPKYGVMHFRPKRLAAPAPDAFNWEDKGFSTPVRNQGNCGSCWAFGGTQTIEMAYRIFAGKSIDFSEQDLVGRLFSGCGGGYFTGDFQVSKGQLSEADCPYKASNFRCKRVPPAVAGQGVKWGMVGQHGRSPTVDELQASIQNFGGIAVTVTANNSFMNYKGGLSQSCPHGSTNHIVTLTGWKTDKGKVYFKLKNSWGESWGEKGYGWFPAGCYDLAEEASWLAIDAVPCKPPAIKLPAEYVLNYDDDVVLAVKTIPGVSYSWWNATVKLGDGPLLEMIAKESMVVTMKAVNQCGSAEIQTLISIKNP